MQTWLKRAPIIWSSLRSLIIHGPIIRSSLWSLIIHGRPERPCRSERICCIIKWRESMSLIEVFAAAHRIESCKWRESLIKVLAAAHRIESRQGRGSMTLIEVSTAVWCVRWTKWWGESMTLVKVSTAAHRVESRKRVVPWGKNTAVVHTERIKPREAVKTRLRSLSVIMWWIAWVVERGARNGLIKSKCTSLGLEWICSDRI